MTKTKTNKKGIKKNKYGQYVLKGRAGLDLNLNYATVYPGKTYKVSMPEIELSQSSTCENLMKMSSNEYKIGLLNALLSSKGLLQIFKFKEVKTKRK